MIMNILTDVTLVYPVFKVITMIGWTINSFRNT